MSLKFKGDGIYQDSRTGNYYHRPVIAGQRTFRKLQSTTIRIARKEIAVLKTRQLESRLGVGLDPYAKLVTIGQLAKEWIKRDCPDRKGIPRSGAGLEYQTAGLKRLLPFWKNREARSITGEDCRDYNSWRRKQNKKFRLGRSVDAELTILANLVSWAVQNPRKTGLLQNPLPIKPRFDNSALVRHCTAVMPTTDEAFHALASYLLSNKRSQALGWQLLLEGMTGARTSEILACRMDAKNPREAGYQDAVALHINRLKKGIEPWALLETTHGHSPLAEMLLAFRNWHKENYPKCQWFIPGHRANTKNFSTDSKSLTKALHRVCPQMNLPIITSHGLRAYFVRVLRSLGVDDSEIAKRLGHRSGVELVEKTYGISEPGWFGSKRMDFLPDERKPAWHPWIPAAGENIINLSVYHSHTQTIKKESINIDQTPKPERRKTV